jgi:hypothetical protein
MEFQETLQKAEGIRLALGETWTQPAGARVSGGGRGNDCGGHLPPELRHPCI